MKNTIKEQLLDYDTALNLIQEANTQSSETTGYRFGQALYNLLPEKLHEYYNGSEMDFFYVYDRDSVINTFYRYYVGEDNL